MSVSSAKSLEIRAVLYCCALAGCLSGCATAPLAAGAPKGVDLSGEWQINTYLSDDPEKPPVDDSTPASSPRHRGGAGHGAGGGGLGLPGGAGGRNNSPPDELDQFVGGGMGSGAIVGSAAGGPSPFGDTTRPNANHLLQVGGTAGGGSHGGGGKSRRTGYGYLFYAPDRMTITQAGDKVTVRSKSASGDVVTDEYTAGRTVSVVLGNDTAERNAGWKDNIFVVDTKVKGGPEKETDYALDEDGRLIFATLLTGSHMPKGDVKRVYDRVKPGGPE